MWSGETNFADIITITNNIQKLNKSQRIHKLRIKKQFISFPISEKLLLSDVTNADVNRTYGMSEKIYTTFGSSLVEVYLCQVSSL